MWALISAYAVVVALICLRDCSAGYFSSITQELVSHADGTIPTGDRAAYLLSFDTNGITRNNERLIMPKALVEAGSKVYWHPNSSMVADAMTCYGAPQACECQEIGPNIECDLNFAGDNTTNTTMEFHFQNGSSLYLFVQPKVTHIGDWAVQVTATADSITSSSVTLQAKMMGYISLKAGTEPVVFPPLVRSGSAMSVTMQVPSARFCKPPTLHSRQPDLLCLARLMSCGWDVVTADPC